MHMLSSITVKTCILLRTRTTPFNSPPISHIPWFTLLLSPDHPWSQGSWMSYLWCSQPSMSLAQRTRSSLRSTTTVLMTRGWIWTSSCTCFTTSAPALMMVTVRNINLSSIAQSVGEQVKKALLLAAARRQNITRHCATKFSASMLC